MADKLTIDFDEMANAISFFQQAYGEMIEAYQNAEDALELLRETRWRSVGKNQYFEMVDTVFDSHEKRMALVSETIKNLKETQRRYETIYELIPKLVDSLKM